MIALEATLDERGSRYGDFSDHAIIAQDIQNAMRRTAGWAKLSPVHAQALTVIADKIARILNGDPNYDDNWHDIQGYAKLVEDRLPKKASSVQNESTSAKISEVLQFDLDSMIENMWHVASVVVMPPNRDGKQKISARIERRLDSVCINASLPSVHNGTRYSDIVDDLISEFKKVLPEGPWQRPK